MAFLEPSSVGKNELHINKPEPIITTQKLEVFHRATNAELTIKNLKSGKPILITGFFSNGMLLQRELQMHLKKTLPNNSFQEQRDFRDIYHKLSNLILIEILDHELAVKKAPSIGWLKKLYPETKNFLLSFAQVQGLNSSWQWYHNGISIPVLRNRIHPFYGTYFPTRFDHLILFDNWLKRYEGSKKYAIDVGIGSGVLSFLMLKHGFQKIFGTDKNPNAIAGLRDFMGDTKLSRKIELDYGHLFGTCDKQSELIVFNPPWLPETKDLHKNDAAIYYDENLFPDFFEQAKKWLLPDGNLVIIFSNLAQITRVRKDHPVELELAQGERFELSKFLKKSVKPASDKTKRDQHWRTTEYVELWVLKHK